MQINRFLKLRKKQIRFLGITKLNKIEDTNLMMTGNFDEL